MKKLITILLFAFVTLNVAAQNQITVSGQIIDAMGNSPMAGVSVLIKGTTNGTITDLDGNYTIKADTAAVLSFSMMGFETQEIVVGKQSKIDISMNEDTKNIDEVVVVGYGTQKKSEITGSIASVSSDDIAGFNSGNAMNSLQSKVNGVQISNTGTPGSTPRVIIRGVSTVNGSNPLYVVDGMPVGDNINFLNPDDIETMEVLKDASSAAIYGTRASNGVIIITTKKGKNSKTKFQFSSTIGVSSLSAPDMAGASEYEKVFKARYTNDGQVAPYNGIENITDQQGTDWWDETVNQYSYTQNYNLSFQGGNDKIIYSGSFGYYRADSHYDYGYWEKFTGRFNTEYKFNKYVKLGVELAPKIERWDDTPNLMGAAMSMDPTTSIYVGGDDWSSDMYNNFSRSNNNQNWNPVASLYRMTAHSNEYGLMTNAYVDITPIQHLTVRSQFGDNARFRISDSFTPKFYIDNLEKSDYATASRSSYTWNDWSWVNTATYSNSFGKHNYSAMVGYTMEKYNYYWLSGSSDEVPSNQEDLRYVSAGTKNDQASGSDSFSSLVSYLGRLTYNYDQRYYLSATMRADGSSKFTDDNRFAYFPSVSAAWRVTGEQFMKSQNIFSNLKLRAGWGKVGNQNIDNSAYLSTLSTVYYTVNGSLVTGTAVGSTSNPNVQWETVEDYNIGIDMGFLQDRLTVTAEIYKKKTSDMLLKQANLNLLGYPEWNGEIWTNVGSMEANGWELSVNYKNSHKSGFGYEVGLNLSGVKNEAVDLGSSNPINAWGFNNDYIIRNENGGEISRFYGYECLGIFQNWEEVLNYTDEHGNLLQPKAQPGDLIFADLNNDGSIDADDKTYIGSAFPDLYLGLNIALTYNEWDLSMNFYGTFGNDIFNKTKEYYKGGGGQNVYAGTYDQAWSYEGQDTDIPRLSYDDANGNYTTVSSWYVEDGDYLRCKQIQLGYTFPKSMISRVGLRLSVSAQNLFTITDYSGMDPETAATGSVTSTGVDNVAYPNPKTFLFGLNLTF